MEQVIVHDRPIDGVERPDLALGFERPRMSPLILKGVKELCDWITNYKLSRTIHFLPDPQGVEEVTTQLRVIAMRWLMPSG